WFMALFSKARPRPPHTQAAGPARIGGKSVEDPGCMGPRTFFGHHIALGVAALIFCALLAAAGLRSTPGVLMVPWEQAFGWPRSSISFAAATGIVLFGITGPFAAAAMQRFGIRATMIAALAMMCLSSAASLFMTQSWQLVVTWGL